jgi:hypothetical protein
MKRIPQSSSAYQSEALSGKKNLTEPECRAEANATNSDAETTTATDCWSQKAVPEKWLQISAGEKN